MVTFLLVSAWVKVTVPLRVLVEVLLPIVTEVPVPDILPPLALV